MRSMRPLYRQGSKKSGRFRTAVSSGTYRLYIEDMDMEELMNTSTKPLAALVEELVPEDQAQVRAFVESLLTKRKPVGKLRQDWAGALRDVRDQGSALELQRKALDWRGD